MLPSVHCADNTAPLLPNFSSSDFEETASAEELGETWNITPRRVYELAQRNILPASKDGRFPLKASTRAYMKFLTQGDGLQRRQAAAGVGRGRTGSKSKLEEVQLQRAQLKLGRERGEYIPLSLYRSRMAAAFGLVRDRMLALPDALHMKLIGAQPEQIREKIDFEVRRALVSLASEDFCEACELSNIFFTQTGRDAFAHNCGRTDLGEYVSPEDALKLARERAGQAGEGSDLQPCVNDASGPAELQTSAKLNQGDQHGK